MPVEKTNTNLIKAEPYHWHIVNPLCTKCHNYKGLQKAATIGLILLLSVPLLGTPIIALAIYHVYKYFTKTTNNQQDSNLPSVNRIRKDAQDPAAQLSLTDPNLQQSEQDSTRTEPKPKPQSTPVIKQPQQTTEFGTPMPFNSINPQDKPKPSPTLVVLPQSQPKPVAAQSQRVVSQPQSSVQPNECDEALAYATKCLKDNENIEPTPFLNGFKKDLAHQPSEDILKLHTLYLQKENEFNELLKVKGNNQDDPEVIAKGKEWMMLGYVISRSTLEVLDDFVKNSSGADREQPLGGRIDALTRQTSYQYRTFYLCTLAYHRLRAGKDEHADKFYQKGTPQHEWNVLYNDYCSLIDQYVVRDDLKKGNFEGGDPRHDRWTQVDTEATRKKFRSRPDTLPT